MTTKKKKTDPQTDQTTTPIQAQNDLAQKVEMLQTQLDTMTETAKRALADLQNFKRRTEEDKKSLALFANMEIVLQLLPVIDNFRRAFAHVPQELRGNDWIEGIYRIEKQFTEALKNIGIIEIPSTGNSVNPLFHEVVMQGAGEKDIVLEEFERGYMFQGKVLRPAKVKVGNGEPGNL